MKAPYLCLVVLFTTSAFGSSIMPEMTRNRKTRSDSLAGVAWAKRNAAALELVRGDQEVDEGSAGKADIKSFATNPYGFFTKDQFSGELSYLQDKTTTDYSPEKEDKTKALDLKTAYRINEKFAALFGYNNSKLESKTSDTDENTSRGLELGASYNHGNGLIAALGYSFNKFKTDDASNGENEVSYGTVKLGAGFQNWNSSDGYSVEAAIELTGNKEGTKDDFNNYNVQEEKKVLKLNGIYANGPWQFDADFNYEAYENNLSGTNNHGDISTYALAVEYLVTQYIYANTSFTKIRDSYKEDGSYNVKLNTAQYSIGGGYRSAQYDVSLKYLMNDYKDEPSDDFYDYEVKGNLITLNGAYFF